jgi:hypothetical protein
MIPIDCVAMAGQRQKLDPDLILNLQKKKNYDSAILECVLTTEKLSRICIFSISNTVASASQSACVARNQRDEESAPNTAPGNYVRNYLTRYFCTSHTKVDLFYN